MKANTTVEFVVPPRQWGRFSERLLAARAGREEVIGFFFCTRHRVAPHAVRLLPRVWVVPEPDCYDHQSIGGLALKQSFHSYLVENYVKHGMDVVHIHTHPSLAPPDFSGVDDRHEAEYARFLAGVPGRPYLVSGVFNERLERGRFRLWAAGGEAGPRAVSFSHGWAPGDAAPDAAPVADPRFDRQRVFGSGVQEALGRLKVGLVGCGGLGAVFAEQLARLGVRQWVLIDPDQLDVTNLNRMPCATPAMAKRNLPKVDYVKELVSRAWKVGATVRKLPAPVEDRRAENLLAACDLIVAATDNHRSRMICQELALRYVRPLLCLGVDIVLSDSGGVRRLLARITMPPVDGGWCLMCGDVIDVPQAALEAAPQTLATDMEAAGYVRGVTAPAVYWLNSTCASLGVYAVHGALASFVDVNHGFDWMIDLEVADRSAPPETDLPGCLHALPIPKQECPNCFHCSADGTWAAGRAPAPKRSRPPLAESGVGGP